MKEDKPQGCGASHTLLPLSTNSRDLFKEIERLSYVQSNSIEFISGRIISGEIEDNFSTYLATNEEGETCYGVVTEDAYGKPLRWVMASVLQSLSNHDGVKNNQLNKQAWAYINICLPNMRIALYWN